MTSLLPNRFKKIGILITPFGLILWLLMQRGLITNLLSSNFSKSTINATNTAIATIGFFSFLIGLYLISFSKEKLEDEMISKIRLECFQFAALIQIISIIIGFVLIAFLGEPEIEEYIMVFIFYIIMFWLTYIIRFNLTLRKLNQL